MNKLILILSLILPGAVLCSAEREKNNKALWEAVKAKDISKIEKALATKNFDINCQDASGKTPMTWLLVDFYRSSWGDHCYSSEIFNALLKHNPNFYNTDDTRLSEHLDKSTLISLIKLGIKLSPSRQDCVDAGVRTALCRKYNPLIDEYRANGSSDEVCAAVSKYLITDLGKIVAGYLSGNFSDWLGYNYSNLSSNLDAHVMLWNPGYFKIFKCDNEHEAFNNAFVAKLLSLGWYRKAFEDNLNNDIEIIKSNKCDVNICSITSGNTLLICTAYCGMVNLVEHLLKNKKIDVSTKDFNDKTALDYVKDKRIQGITPFGNNIDHDNEKIIKLIESHMNKKSSSSSSSSSTSK